MRSMTTYNHYECFYAYFTLICVSNQYLLLAFFLQNSMKRCTIFWWRHNIIIAIENLCVGWWIVLCVNFWDFRYWMSLDFEVFSLKTTWSIWVLWCLTSIISFRLFWLFLFKAAISYKKGCATKTSIMIHACFWHCKSNDTTFFYTLSISIG